jgi:hypothetical protein
VRSPVDDAKIEFITVGQCNYVLRFKMSSSGGTVIRFNQHDDSPD